MYIGTIKEFAKVEFYRAGTTVPFEPERIDGSLVWKWDRVFDSEIDIKYTFDRFSYIGDIELGISGAAEISVFVDGSRVACKKDEPVARVNLNGTELIVRVRGNLEDIVLKAQDVFGFFPDDDEPLLFPRPKDAKISDKLVNVGNIIGTDDDSKFAASFLIDSLRERFGFEPKENGIDIRFEICPEYEAERYTVAVYENNIVVKAAARLPLLWGASRIIDIWCDGAIPVVAIDDKPDVPMRGFHMGLPRADRIDFIKRFFRYVLIPLGYNHVIVEFSGAMRFDRHPEIAEKWLEADRMYRNGERRRIEHGEMGADGTVLEKEQVREMLAVLEEYGIEVIPEVQSFGHVQYLTNAHPEIAELNGYKKTEGDARNVDILHPDSCGHCYCPSREDSMRYIFDIIDEILEVARPKRYVHIGHDEIYHIGECPLCKGKSKADIYVNHVKTLYDYMAERGLKVMIWSDMLHRDMYYTGEPLAGVKSRLPKDIMLLDFTWYFAFDVDIEDELLPEGYEVMMGNLYSSHYPRYASRIAKKGMVGGQLSTWIAVSEKTYAEYGKFFDLVYTSEMLWNAYSYDERNRSSFTALIGQCMLPEMRDLIRGRYDLYDATDIGTMNVVGRFPGDDRRIPEEILHVGVTEPVGKIEIGAKYERLVFEHATLHPMPRVAWVPLSVIGSYTVTYADGATVNIPISYGGEVMYWKSVYATPMPQQYYRHSGYSGTWLADPTYEGRTAEGDPILLMGMPWDNPHPDKIIESIEYTPVDNDYACLISGGVWGVRK